MEEVGPTRGSGWVDDQTAIFPLVLKPDRLTHPLPRVVLTSSNNDL